MTLERAFSPACTREAFLETAGIAEALRRLDAGLGAREPFLLVTGEPGAGKTALVREAIARWESRVTAAFLAYSALSGEELLEEIVLRFSGVAADGASRPRLIAALERTLGEIAGTGRVPLIVVDDAQKLAPELLEELRLLVNAAEGRGQPLEVLLVGLPALERMLDDPALASLRERIAVRARLEPLSAGETAAYLRRRADAAGGDGASLFPRSTCDAIAQRSGGIPRRINLIAAEALERARAAGASVVQLEQVMGDAPRSQAGPAQTERAPVSHSSAPVPRASHAPAAPSPATPAGPHAPSAAAAQSRPPAPSAAAVRPAPPPPAAPAPVPEPASSPPPSQDPTAWVARFLGDKGPIQIGSRAEAEPMPREVEFGPAGEALPRPKPKPRAAKPAPRAPRAKRGPAPAAAPALAAAALVAVGLAAFVFLLVRAGVIARGGVKPDATRTGYAPAPAPAATDAHPRRARAHAPVASDSASYAVEAVASSRGPFSIDVGGAGDLQSALVERDRVQALTGIQTWVATAPEGAAQPYRIVVGAFRARARAASAAQMLLRSRTLGEARVIPLPRASDRE